MTQSQYGVLLFHTTWAALRAEKVLKDGAVPCKLIPVPRQFSSNCGLALRFGWDQHDAVVAAMQVAGVEVEAVHTL
ncbi:MAG: DUF3343 domain-containing protein [Chloroflexota bacterium]